MIKEALAYLAEKFTSAAGEAAKFHRPKEEPDFVYWHGGERILATPAARFHSAIGLETIIKFAKQYDNASTWYSRSGVVCLLDDDTRRDRVSMKLSYSPQLLKIQPWGEQSAPLTQQAVVLMLRTLFKRNMSQCPKLIDCLRHVKFASGSVTDSGIAKGKASLSKSIESKVSGVEEIPDEVYFNVPIFTEPFANIESLIDVAIEMDGGTERFTLHPIPGAVEKAICLAESVIGKTLIEALGEDRVFYGMP